MESLLSYIYPSGRSKSLNELTVLMSKIEVFWICYIDIQYKSTIDFQDDSALSLDQTAERSIERSIETETQTLIDLDRLKKLENTVEMFRTTIKEANEIISAGASSKNPFDEVSDGQENHEPKKKSNKNPFEDSDDEDIEEFDRKLEKLERESQEILESLRKLKAENSRFKAFEKDVEDLSKKIVENLPEEDTIEESGSDFTTLKNFVDKIPLDQTAADISEEYGCQIC
jgi:hypothetical protein